MHPADTTTAPARRRAAPGLKVTAKTRRTGRRMPIAARYEA